METLSNMNKQRKRISIPLLLIVGLLIYCWTMILFTDAIATWQHYTGLLLFLPKVFLYFSNLAKVVVGTVIYLVLATFNLLAITSVIQTSWITLNFAKPISTPPIQLLSFGIFALYVILNLDTLIEMRLDYREAKAFKAGMNKDLKHKP